MKLDPTVLSVPLKMQVYFLFEEPIMIIRDQ